MERLNATYLIETPNDLGEATSALAGEQSSGTFVSVPGETDSLRKRFGARVERITPLETCQEPSLPGSSGTGPFQRAEVVVSWPIENFGYNLPAIVSTVQGNLYELRQFSGLKLIDLQFPASFAQQFAGPSFGIEGTRKLANVYDRPLIGTIIKPSVGFAPEQTAELVSTLLEAGIDFIKDDELMADPPHNPFNERVEAVMRVINDHAQRTGKKAIYAFNITDELTRMYDHYDTICRHDGNCAMVSLNSVGLAAVKAICDRGQLAIHGHRNGWGMLSRHPALGMEFTAYQKLWRLAGVDQIHVNGLDNKFCESDSSVLRSIAACHARLLGGFPVLPVVSSGQWGGQAFETYRCARSIDFLYLAGGGIMAHPSGPKGGLAAILDAWDGAIKGESLEQTMQQSREFALAVEKFGNINKSSQCGATATVS